MVGGFAEKGYCRFGFDPALKSWAEAALPLARAAVADPEQRARWLVCQGTWFVGVDALPNGGDGAIGDVPLAGEAIEFAEGLFGALPLHPAQVSVVWPGYPRPRQGESEAAFRYREKRDAAHLDGVKASGADRRRRIEEAHGWILGIPLNEAGAGASPLVVWDGSHKVMRARLLAALNGMDEAGWGEVDVTEAYQAARQEVFETCARIELAAKPGEAYLLHRLSLHGVAPWRQGPDEGRMVAYFRPEMPGGVAEWLKGLSSLI
ncbi:hypothetical protein RXV86_16160 [Alisedimentitalea sp. MJ-SS2]|uniref:hypothetical protein n=1 Tax=Aliisedimentitalea sp. MJ-SS2 TaxID=3049795 RepID=UPI002912B54A|nr:hypothetical protein [Alisedimentitalea sp. MJ-SS2]MDU8928928.1 hypothetical protein [Alisedimentitalea sp. MJ-SS2]